MNRQFSSAKAMTGLLAPLLAATAILSASPTPASAAPHWGEVTVPGTHIELSVQRV